LIRLDRVYQGWLDKEVAKVIEMAGWHESTDPSLPSTGSIGDPIGRS
jgi:hypothetical protein